MSGIFSCYLASINGQGLSRYLLKMAIHPCVFLNTVLMRCLLTAAVNTHRRQSDGNDRVRTSNFGVFVHCPAVPIPEPG